ncbi:unnamed protein product, partial [Staurois parvus]
GAQQCHPPVPPTCAQQCAHLCLAVHPPVPFSSATYLCPPSVPSSDASQCHLSVLSISATYQCRLSVTPH